MINPRTYCPHTPTHNNSAHSMLLQRAKSSIGLNSLESCFATSLPRENETSSGNDKLNPSLANVECKSQVQGNTVQEMDSFKEALYNQVRLAKDVNLKQLESEISIRGVSLLRKPTKKVIIFDLDETLILNDGIRIHVRPYLHELLQTLADKCELWLWSASTREYIDDAMKLIGEDSQYFTAVLDESYCICINGKPVKDARVFDISLRDVVIVDNYLFSFAGTLSNGILISAYDGSYEDNELLLILQLLASVIECEDVQAALKQAINIESYLQF